MATPRIPPGQLAERRDRALDLFGGLPEAEREGERHVAFRVRRRTFAWLVDDDRGDGRLAVHLRPVQGDPTALIAADPDGRFAPDHVGARGWLGLYVDVEVVDWEALEGFAVESFVRVAPQRLAAQLGR